MSESGVVIVQERKGRRHDGRVSGGGVVILFLKDVGRSARPARVPGLTIRRALQRVEARRSRSTEVLVRIERLVDSKR